MEVDWLDVKNRVNSEMSERYRRIMLNPDPICDKCNGTGISKYTYNCGALNCRGHHDVICSCRELDLDCPYGNEHPNISGNWTTKYVDGKVIVECYNVREHRGNKYGKCGEMLHGWQRTVLFEVKDLESVQ